MSSVLLLVLAAADGGLSIADVEPGELLEYGLTGDRVLTLRACGRTDRAVLVEVTLSPSAGLALEHLVAELPIAPLSPRVELPPAAEEHGVTVDDRQLQACATWRSEPAGTHAPRSRVTRCSERALILGSGLMSLEESRLGQSSRGTYSRSASLRRIGSRPGACPALPPVAPGGSFDAQFDGEPRPTSFTIAAGSTWTRSTWREGRVTRTSEAALIDVLLSAAWNGPVRAPTKTSVTLNGKAFPGWTDGDARWLDGSAVVDVPLEVRVQPIIGRGRTVLRARAIR